jgi:hypothetical protein
VLQSGSQIAYWTETSAPAPPRAAQADILDAASHCGTPPARQAAAIDFGKHFGHAAQRRFRRDHAVVDVGRRQATPSSALHEACGLAYVACWRTAANGFTRLRPSVTCLLALSQGTSATKLFEDKAPNKIILERIL